MDFFWKMGMLERVEGKLGVKKGENTVFDSLFLRC
jgi:hypothetical protein